MMKRVNAILLYTLVLCSACPVCMAASTYNIEILGQNIEAWSLNDSGQVVIYPFDGHTYIWDKGSVSDVGRIGDDAVFTQDINNSGQVVGFHDNGNGEQAFAGTIGNIQDLGISGSTSVAMCVNNQGIIAGIRTVNGIQRGFVKQGNTVNTIPGVSGTVWAYAINDSGAVVGDGYAVVNGATRKAPYIYQNGATTVLPVTTWGTAQGINNFNQVSGTFGVSGGNHAYLYDDGSFEDIGGLISNCSNSWAIGINDSGQVAVQAFYDQGERSGFLYEDGHIFNLADLLAEPLGWEILSVEDINASGQMVGSAIYNGTYCAYMMTPVPEPATLVLLGLGGMMLRKRRG